MSRAVSCWNSYGVAGPKCTPMSFLSHSPPFRPFVYRVTRVRRVFARVGGHQLCTQSRAPVYEPQGSADVAKGSAFKIRISARISRRRYLNYRAAKQLWNPPSRLGFSKIWKLSNLEKSLKRIPSSLADWKEMYRFFNCGIEICP